MGRVHYLAILSVFVFSPFIGPSHAVAAPFCAEAINVSPQCFYYDARICRQDAKNLGGVCRVNEEEVSLPEGYGNYCLVYSATMAECLYLDYNSCEQEATRKNGICIRNSTKPEPLPSLEYNSEDAYQSF